MSAKSINVIKNNYNNTYDAAHETIARITLEISEHPKSRCIYKDTLEPTPKGGGGGVLWYFHTYVGSGYLFEFKILNFNIFGGFQKNEYVLGVWWFCKYFCGVITKLG